MKPTRVLGKVVRDAYTRAKRGKFEYVASRAEMAGILAEGRQYFESEEAFLDWIREHPELGDLGLILEIWEKDARK